MTSVTSAGSTPTPLFAFLCGLRDSAVDSRCRVVAVTGKRSRHARWSSPRRWLPRSRRSYPCSGRAGEAAGSLQAIPQLAGGREPAARIAFRRDAHEPAEIEIGEADSCSALREEFQIEAALARFPATFTSR